MSGDRPAPGDGPRPGFTPDGDIDVATGHRPGAVVDGAGVRFEVWAPDATEVAVRIEGPAEAVHGLVPVPGTEDSTVWRTHVAGCAHDARYRLRVDGEELADPASRHQPDGVWGPSAVVDPSRFDWHDDGWAGVDPLDAVLYELHVGTFTPEGSLDAAIAELPRLAALGVTMVELMPLAQFSGDRGWGYDGVFLSAVQHSYGGPAALARFVDAAHGHGLGVVVDAVFNHFGPEGNVAPRLAPYVTDTYRTPWGAAVNVSVAHSDEVRRFFVDVARWWIEDLHVDGLRLDAVHAIVDPTARPFLEELCGAAHRLGDRLGRRVSVFLESSDNDPRTVTAPPHGLGGDGVWNDEYHHALRVAVTGDRSGYYADFTGVDDIVDVLTNGFTYRGRYSRVRGRRHGRPPVGVEPHRFVVFGQNHDQVGNRRDGERLDVLVDGDRRRLVLAAVLLSPFTPMLFMGEEYGERAPFPFFADHADPALRDAVRRGRAEEFASFAWSGEPPDPYAEETVRSAVLHTAAATGGDHRRLHELTAELLALRGRLRSAHPADRRVWRRGDVVAVERRDPPVSTVLLSFGDTDTEIDLGPLEVVLDTADVRWGGSGAAVVQGSVVRPRPWSALVATDGRVRA